MRYRTTEPRGYLPAGMLVEAAALRNTSPSVPSDRDYYLTRGSGDGQWLIIRYPGGILHKMVRIPEPGHDVLVRELEGAGIRLADLEET